MSCTSVWGYEERDDPTLKVWRFISLAKYLDFLRTSELFFCRADKLLDPYEGMMPDDLEQVMRPQFEKVSLSFDKFLEDQRQEHFINSWHMSEHESAAMWTLYSGPESGVAVCSTYGQLCWAFNDQKERVTLASVRYGEAVKTDPSLQTQSLFIHKRKSFEHERELRAFVLKGAEPVLKPGMETQFVLHDSVRVRIDISKTITEAVLDPTAPAWVLPSLQDVTERYEHGFTVRQSSLYKLSYKTS